MKRLIQRLTTIGDPLFWQIFAFVIILATVLFMST